MILDARVLNEATDHAMKEMPKEACGVVCVISGKLQYVPCKNVSPIPNTFEIDANDYANAEEQGEVVRIIHSHCYQSPVPSESDKVSCEHSGVPWSIVSVPNGVWHHFEPKGYKAPLVGRDWLHGVLDCYALIRDYYQEVLGTELLDFDRQYEWWMNGDNLFEENFQKAGFREVPEKELKKHDVLLMQIHSPVINHGAIYLGDGLILHQLHRRLSSRDVYGGYWKKHTVKVIRHENN